MATRVLVVVAWFGGLLMSAGRGCAKQDPANLLRSSSVPSPNLLRNSTFTQCANPGVPDWWGTSGPEQIEKWEGVYGTETDSPVVGTNSLRIGAPLAVQSYANLLPSGRQYTFSLYLKGSQEGLPVALYIGDKSETVKATCDWQRYAFSASPQKGHWASGRLIVKFGIFQPGTLWVAAPQLEYGSQATPYQPSASDAAVSPKAGATVPLPQEALPLPETHCVQTAQPPTIDGKLDDSCWTLATAASGFRDIQTGRPASADTEVRTLRDADSLYVAVRCMEPDVSRIVAKTTTRDGPVFGEDCIEIFLQPEPSSSDYLHLAANAAGGQYDEKVYDSSWDANWKVATSRGTNYWCAEFAIPFAGLDLTPRMKKAWRFNVGRNRPRGEGNSWTAWSCTYGGFHTPSRFGTLHISEAQELARFGYEVNRLDLEALPAGSLGLRLTLGARPPRTKKVLAEATVASRSSGARVDLTGLSLGRRARTFTLPLLGLKPEPGDYRVQLTLRNEAHGPPVHQVIRRVAFQPAAASPGPPLSAVFELSYYTSEPEARLWVKSNLSAAATVKVQLGGLPSGQVTSIVPQDSVRLAAGRETLVPCSLSGLACGEYEATITLVAKKGQAESSAHCKLIKLPAATTEVKMNRLSRSLLVNGKPFIAYAQGIHGFRTDWWLEDIQAHHFNSVVGGFSAPASKEELDGAEPKVREFLDACERRSLKVVFWMHAPPGPFDAACEAVMKTIERFKDHPAILCWYLVDEPEGWWEAAGRKESDLLDLYKAAKAADPYRPSHINWYSWVKGKGAYGGLDATDIGSVDRYPIGRDNAMKVMTDITKLMNDDCRPRFQPTAFWCQMYGYDDAIREPTPEEQRCMTYLCLTHGMRLIYYFIYKPMSVATWESMTPLGDEIAALTPVLADPSARELAVGMLMDTVSYSMWESRGHVYFLAANGSYEPFQATFDVAKLARRPLKRKATVWFEGRTVRLQWGKLTDSFNPLARHVYELR